MAGSEIPVRESLYNKFASLMPWRLLTVLERDTSTGIYLCKFLEMLFCRTPHSNHFSHDVVFSSLNRSLSFAV